MQTSLAFASLMATWRRIIDMQLPSFRLAARLTPPFLNRGNIQLTYLKVDLAQRE
jgi:hypothetical protein